jgi:hypothetical protein
VRQGLEVCDPVAQPRESAFHRTGTKRFHHPLVGDLALAYEALELPADPGLTIVTFSAEPGTPAEQTLNELARWSSTRARLTSVGTENDG